MAATAAIEKVASRNPDNLYSMAPPELVGGRLPTISQADLAIKWIGQTPSPAMLNAIVKMPNKSALACVDARAAALASGPIVDDAAGRARLKAMGFNGKFVFLNALSLPVFAPSGDEAVIAVSVASNQLAGGSSLLFLRRLDGRWQVVGRKDITIS